MQVETYLKRQTAARSARGVVPSGDDIASLRVRLARAILELAERAELDVANSIFVTRAVSNDQLAALAAGKPRTIARLVEQFKIHGLVETRRERLIIRQPERLQAIIASAA